jgi:hypothetical protein
MDKRRELRNQRLSDGRCGGALNDFTVAHGFAVQRLVAGLVRFQSGAVKIETGERSISVTEEQNLGGGIILGRLSIPPLSRSPGADCEPIGKQFRAPLLIQRQDDDVDLLAAELYAQTAAFPM